MLTFSNQSKNRTYETGFTLVETLVSITILLMVIITPMTIVSRSIQSAYHAGDQLAATHLAQEGVEIILRMRDDQALKAFADYYLGTPNTDTNGWYGTLDNSCRETNPDDTEGCDIALENTASDLNQIDGYKDCGASATECRLLTYIGSDASIKRLYGYGSGSDWSESQFTRAIKVIDRSPGGTGDGPFQIISTVSWYSTVFKEDRVVTIESWIYDHYNRFSI